MAYSPYFIGPYKVGLETDLDSYLIPEDAFPELENAYVWRGRVYKKGGYELLGEEAGSVYAGRLGLRFIPFAVRTAGADVYNLAITANALDLPIQPGTLIITDGVTAFVDNGTGGFTVLPAPGNGTVNAPTNYTTSAINITFNIGNNLAPVIANFLVLPGANSPVMGLREFDINNNIQSGLVAFDLKSAYQFNRTTSLFDQTRFYKDPNHNVSNLVNWTGSDTDFFFTNNYEGALFATNNIPGANFYTITNVVTGATTQLTIGANNLAINDTIYVNNVIGVLDANGDSLINGRTALVTAPGNPVTVAINTAAVVTAYNSGGVLWEMNKTKTGGGDGIRWFDGFTAGLAPITGWVNFEPSITHCDAVTTLAAGNLTGVPTILQGCLLLFPYKGYFVALNTVEGTLAGTAKRFTNRARWSTGGDATVYYSSLLPVGQVSFDQDAWVENLDFRGGHQDAPTTEDIIAAEFIKDTLVVYFESSTWKLTYTGNPEVPFIWEKINTEIGATSTFSTVPFDRNVLSVGPNGIYACDSINIDRIDRIIPDTVFSFNTVQSAAKRIHGIRNFYSESVQWTYVENDQATTSLFPTKTLYYNYVNNSFSIFKNCFTCFGHFTANASLTWGGATQSFNFYGRSWNSFSSNAGFPIVVTGNQQGFVFRLQNADGSQITANDTSLVIQNISAGPPSVFTIINHNLQDGDFILLSKVGGIPAIDGQIFKVQGNTNNPNYNTNTFTVQDVNGNTLAVAGYTFGGLVTIIDDFSIKTKNLNPFFQDGKSIRLGYADFFIDNLENEEGIAGNVTVNLYLNNNSIVINENYAMSLQDVTDANNDQFWTRVFFRSQAQFLSVEITYDDAQLFNPIDSQETFVLHGSIFWMKPAGRLLPQI
jgi:hypothetical protein